MNPLHPLIVKLTTHPDEYVRSLALSHPLREPLLRAVLEHLGFARDSEGVDLGCGIGLPAIMAATAPLPCRRVTGVDIREDFIAIARQNAAALSLGEDRLTFEQGNISQLPHHSDGFDWALSVDCVNYNPNLPRGVLSEIKRVLRPGGKVALLAWSSQQILPGFPDIEAQLNTTRQGLAPFEPGSAPQTHFSRTSGVLAEAGFVEIQAKTFVQDIQAPLSPPIRAALLSLWAMRWGKSPSELAADKQKVYQRLTRPGGEDFILKEPSYYGFFTYTLFVGHNPPVSRAD